jgi:hypothetical protein
VASCNGTTCSYTCNAGASDCDKATAPDTDGCECPTPGCCGTGCDTTHVNGLGEDYYDCNPLDTYEETTAMEACVAYAASQGQSATWCQDGWGCTAIPSITEVCHLNAANGTTCSGDCWVYTGTSEIGWVTTCANCETEAATWN